MAKTIEMQKKSISEYIEDAHKNNYRWIDTTRYEHMLELLDGDCEETTAITYGDVLEAFEAMQEARKHCDEVNEPEVNARYAISSARDCVSMAKRGRTKYTVEEAMAVYEERKAAYKDFWHTDEYHKLSTEAYHEKDVAEKVFRAIRKLHVRQCATIALEAMLEDTCWTKQPVRYKRMKAKVYAITDKALAGTGCYVSVYDSGAVHVNHCHASFFTHYENGDDVELYLYEDGNERPDLERMRSDLEHRKDSTSQSLTLAEVRDLIAEYRAAQQRIGELREAYQKEVDGIIAPYAVLEMRDDLDRYARVHY